MFCKHDWEIIQEVTTESQFDQLMKTCGRAPEPNYTSGLNSLMQKKHITTLKCNKCGKLKRFVEVI